jgi:hypothetical protein
METGARNRQNMARLKRIHARSRQLAAERGESHLDRLLEMMRLHCGEITALCGRNDPHWRAETGDLIVLCLELLLEAKVSPEAAVETSFGRFEKKLFPGKGADDGRETSF